MKYSAFILTIFLISASSCKKNEESKPIVQDIKELIFASGELQWENSYNLTAQTDGILSNATFELGDLVNKGKILANIDNPISGNNTQSSMEQLVISNQNLTDNAPAIQQLQQNITFAESKYEQDKLQSERYERLLKSESIAKVEYENVLLTAKNSLANLNALQKQKDQLLQQAKQQQITVKTQVQNNKVLQNYNRIVVPIKGTIIKKMKNNGDYVRKGEVIATIADNQQLEVVLNVDENSIGKIKVGQPVFIQLNTNKGTVLNGTIKEILAAFDNASRSFICKVKLSETLLNSIYGTQLEANILVGEKKNALLIPRNYVGFGNKIFIKDKEEPIIFKPGIISSQYIEVLEGINQEDILILKKH
jgi:multidrug efflux pump subunit AcrA (membrane-fusion protein)